MVRSVTKAGDLSKFLAWVTSSHMHLVALWRKLDADGSMLLHKSEFTQGLTKLGYTGNVDRLWGIIDRDTTGTISFLEFAPEAALHLARFQRWMIQKFGTSKEMWRQLDVDRSGCLSFHEFVDGCEGVGIPSHLGEHLKDVFDFLDYEVGARSTGKLSQEELYILDAWTAPEYLWQEPDFDAAQRFREALLEKHGDNALIAWRRSLDRDSSMRVSYEEFVRECKSLAKKGFAEAAPACGSCAMFTALSPECTGWISLRDWDPEGFDELATFVMWCRSEYGTVAKFLKAAENTEVFDGAKVENGGLPLSKFSQTLKPSGLSGRSRAKLFQALKATTNRGGSQKELLFPSDVQFLYSWDPERESSEASVWKDMLDGIMGRRASFAA